MKALSSLATLSAALFLTACSLTHQVKDSPAEPNAEQASDNAVAKEKVTAPAPTAEQQNAAEQILNETPLTPPAVNEESEPLMQVSPAPENPPAPAAAPATPTLPGGGLRMGSIVPQEEPASVGDAPPPSLNAVELRGLRSPKMPSKLPMSVDGKLQN